MRMILRLSARPILGLIFAARAFGQGELTQFTQDFSRDPRVGVDE
jgi:hypothetical protein